MRTIFLAVIPIIAAIIGYLLSVKYGQTREFWDKFEYWHKRVKSEIAFSQNSLFEIFGDGGKADLFLSYATKYVRDKNKPLKPNFLSEEEIGFVNKYLQALGTTDKDSQLSFLNSMETELERFIQAAEKKNKTYRPLFVKLGFLFGLILFILLI